MPLPPPPPVPGAESRFAEARGIRFHLVEAGAGEPLILLHGWPQHHHEWRHVIGPLARTHRVLCPDLRGFGWSDAPASGYDPESMAADVLALADELGVERFGLVGHDWGAFFSWFVAMAAPERVRGLVAMCVPHPWPVRDLRSVAALRHFWYQLVNATPGLGPAVISRLPAYTRFLTRHWSAGSHVWTDAELDVYTATVCDPARARAASILYREIAVLGSIRGAFAGASAMPPDVTVPAILLMGADDGCIAPSWARGVERHVDDVTVHIVEGAGHFLPEERPDVVIDHVLDFFA